MTVPSKPSPLCIVLAIINLWPSASHGQTELCLDAIRKVSREAEVPEKVLLAIARIESGRGGDDPLPAWPWAVNQSGRSQWFETREEAEAQVTAALAKGETNVDIGCLQINHRWHGDAFKSLSQMFDPIESTRYAARFLRALYEEHPDWVVAAGKYHSRTPTFAEPYKTRFQAAVAKADATNIGIASRRMNNFPLLQGGASGMRGSTVPAVTGIGSLFFLQARRIIGD